MGTLTKSPIKTKSKIKILYITDTALNILALMLLFLGAFITGALLLTILGVDLS